MYQVTTTNQHGKSYRRLKLSYRIVKQFPVFSGFLTNLKVFHEKQIISSSTKQWKQIIMPADRGKEALKDRTNRIYRRPVTDAFEVVHPEFVPNQPNHGQINQHRPEKQKMNNNLKKPWKISSH
jgi:hypothetical protein